MTTFHGYVHVPFCRVRCGYCDFNTYTSDELDGFPQSSFVAQLKREVELSKKQVEQRPLSTVFFGGGTPTLLPASDLVSSLNILKNAFGLVEGAEVTSEANPDTVDYKYLEKLRDAGFNRISFGMQSAVPSVLKTLERTHNPENVVAAVSAAKDLGFQTSVDLIYGAPGESFDEWQTTVSAALELNTDHISAYALIVEPATRLSRKIASGEISEPDEDLSADKYRYLDQQLELHGFEWYELSNWSKSAETRSSHNLAYWHGFDWWGYGPGAHSHIAGSRFHNLKHPSTYAKKLNDNQLPIADSEVISETSRLEERAMLELRLASGLDLDVVKELNASSSSVIAKFIGEGLLDGNKALAGRAVLTLDGRLLADFVLRKLLGL